ncbi:hypothetical protein C4O09_005022 [Salmonella enterica subsp. enterica serovar Minnesota]|nr:hypothetical protein [Salmonella enterica subsp. enterica serovar Minnesota]
MTTTLNPTITITVSGPTGSGKSRVLALIADVLKLIHGDCIIDAPDVKAEKEMCGNDYTAWHKPRSGTIFKLEEMNQPVNTGRCITTPITTDDLLDRPVPVPVQALMSKFGISFEEYRETSLQPVVDLVNWALMTPTIPEQKTHSDKKENESSGSTPNCSYGTGSQDEDDRVKRNITFSQVTDLIDQQSKGRIDPVTARAAWYGFMNEHNSTDLADYLGSALNGAVKRRLRIPSLQNINTNGLPTASAEQEEQAEKISAINSCVISQLHGLRDTTRSRKFWRKILEEQTNKELLTEILVRAIGNVHDYIEENKPTL